MPQASYATSKSANAKLIEAIASEHLELHVVQVQPGVSFAPFCAILKSFANTTLDCEVRAFSSGGLSI